MQKLDKSQKTDTKLNSYIRRRKILEYKIPTQKLWNYVNKKLKSIEMEPVLKLENDLCARFGKVKAEAKRSHFTLYHKNSRQLGCCIKSRKSNIS